MWLNRWDVEEAAHRHAAHPVLGPATRTLQALVDWTDANSDGWPYWQKPSRASARLQALIHGPTGTRPWDDRPDATPEALKAALKPVKAFRTRQVQAGRPSFEITEV